MKKLACIAIVAIGILGSYSCYQDPGPGTGRITVVDINDFKVPAATVKLSQVGSFIIDEGLTNQDGMYEYTHQDFQVDFGTEVGLNVSATEGGRTGVSYIRIKPEETTSITIRIQ
jgi:hypothetical protein